MSMRTLKEEIAYCREKGFYYSHVPLSTMMYWLGERMAEDDEREAMKLKIARLEHELYLANLTIQDLGGK